MIEEEFRVEILNCEGCGYCARVCPVDAITNRENNVGKWYISSTKVGSTMVHAKLNIAAENSGKLVAKVKNEAKKIVEHTGKKFILVDGSPGIGCPVISSLSGANYVVLVTEPSVSGIHDLKRVYELVKNFKIDAGCIINKSDINPRITDEIKDFLLTENITLISTLPYDESFTESMTMGKVIMENGSGVIQDVLNDSWNKIKELTNKKTE